MTSETRSESETLTAGATVEYAEGLLADDERATLCSDPMCEEHGVGEVACAVRRTELHLKGEYDVSTETE